MTRKLLLCIAAAVAAHGANAAPPSAADRAALEQLAVGLDLEWDAGDAAAMAAYYAADGSLRMDGRPLVQGHEAMRRYFEEMISRRPAGVKHVTRVENIDMVTPDLAFTDAHVRIERDRSEGGRDVLAEFRNQTLAIREAGAWQLRAVRTQRLPVAKPAS